MPLGSGFWAVWTTLLKVLDRNGNQAPAPRIPAGLTNWLKTWRSFLEFEPHVVLARAQRMLALSIDHAAFLAVGKPGLGVKDHPEDGGPAVGDRPATQLQAEAPGLVEPSVSVASRARCIFFPRWPAPGKRPGAWRRPHIYEVTAQSGDTLRMASGRDAVERTKRSGLSGLPCDTPAEKRRGRLRARFKRTLDSR